MANLDVALLSLNAEEAKSVSEIIVETQFINGELNQNYDIQTGISHDQAVVFLSSMGITGKAMTSCTPEEIGGLVFTEKVWRPKLIAGRKKHCAADENQLIKWLKQARNVYNDFFDRNGSPELQMIASSIIASMKLSILAKVWFNDTAAADVSGGGVFSNGTDLGLFNQFDGLFKQIFADASIPKYVISENSAANYASQKLASNRGDEILENVFDNADSRLTSHPDAKFYVTGEILKNFRKTVKKIEYKGGLTETLLNGRSQLTYFDIPIFEEKIFDYVIKNHQDDGTKHNLPHRVVLTTQGNIPIGTLSTSDLENLRSIFDEPNNTNILDFGYFLDALFGESYMASVAY